MNPRIPLVLVLLTLLGCGSSKEPAPPASELEPPQSGPSVAQTPPIPAKPEPVELTQDTSPPPAPATPEPEPASPRPAPPLEPEEPAVLPPVPATPPAPDALSISEDKSAKKPEPPTSEKMEPAEPKVLEPTPRTKYPETVRVGNPGNRADRTGFGAVPYVYWIGKYEVTNAEYCEFLNAVAKKDPHRLYDGRMGGSQGGILRSGRYGSYAYTTKDDGANKPVSFVTWESCARYANWLSHGGGDADLQAGSYSLARGVTLPDHETLAAGADVQWVIASENEWYKAAYHDPDKPGGAGYWEYAVSGGSAPSSNINSNQVSEVGAFKVASPYGTFDQNGNLWEYNETRRGNKVGLRGGSFFINDHTGYLRSHTRYEVLSAKWPNYGFRVVALGGDAEASTVPAKKTGTAPVAMPAPKPRPRPVRTEVKTFYVSQSDGNDAWDGEAAQAGADTGPWKSLKRASIEYIPGDTLLLKRGDVWHEELRPLGNGTPEKPITIGGFGEGAKPVIDREDYNRDRTGIRLSDQGGFKIIGIEFARCMTGIYADYSDNAEPKEYLWIEDCYFHDSLKYQHYEDYPKRKIGLGVCLFSYERENRVILSNITVRNCVFRRLASGFWTNSPDNFNKNASYVYNFKNLVFEDCLFEEGYQWQQGIRGVDTGAMRNCVTHDIGRGFRSFNGVAGSMFFRCKNWVFEDCEWGFVSIGLGSGDGQAFDFEGNCDDMVMRNCLFHDTDGPGVLLCCYASDGHAHSGIVMENCVINGKSKRPIGLPRCAIVNTTDWNESTWRQCRFYLSKGEAVMRVMDHEKDKKTAFVNCRVKDLAAACSSEKLPGNRTQSDAGAKDYWVELDFGQPTAINEFLIGEDASSSVLRYMVELWDADASAWKSCFNGREIGRGFVAPIVERTTTKARLRVHQTKEGQAQIVEFSAYKDPLGEAWNVKRGNNTPNRVGKSRSELDAQASAVTKAPAKPKLSKPLEREMAWDTKALFAKPKQHESDERPAKNLRSFFYEGAHYKGKPTWVFAYYAAPKGEAPEGGWPAVVCAHGGGGTAYPEWVRFWNGKGYAALAMDLEGHLPGGSSHQVEGGFPTGKPHPNAGPSRIDWFGDRDLPDHEQWFYHAVADVIRANSLLRSFPEINPDNIGLTGISWGGTVASTAAGVDPRFAFAIPVYGGGYIHESDNEGLAQWFPPKHMTDKQFHDYRAKWDPSAHLPHAKMPILWVTSVADPVFQINIFAKSAETAAGDSRLCMRPWMIHAHGNGWNDAPEITQFADSIVKDGPALPKLSKPVIHAATRTVRTAYQGKGQFTEAWIYYTNSKGRWKQRKWHFIQCNIGEKELVSQKPLPKEATGCLVYVFRDRGGYRDNHTASDLLLLGE